MYPYNTLAHYITDLPHHIDLLASGSADSDTVPTYVGADDTWLLLNETVALRLTPSARIAAENYKSPVILMNHVNKGLEIMGRIR